MSRVVFASVAITNSTSECFIDLDENSTNDFRIYSTSSSEGYSGSILVETINSNHAVASRNTDPNPFKDCARAFQQGQLVGAPGQAWALLAS